MTSPDIQIVSKHLIASHGTTQIRCVQPAEALRAAGYSVCVNTIYRTTPMARKLIILHRVALDPYTQVFITCAQARGIPIIYDTDDLLFDSDGIGYLTRGPKAQNYARGWKPYADVMAMTDAVTVSTDFLGIRARHVNPNTHVILNTLSNDYLRTAGSVADNRQTAKRDSITLAYLSGSRSHDADFATIEDALIRTLRKHPTTRLLLVGPLDVSEKFANLDNQIIRRDFKPYSEFPHVFDEIDINLIPLETNQVFCHAKSELKFIEAAACGVVSVASPTDPHKAAIEHGINGLLATSDWDNCLDALIEDRTMRERLALEGRRYVTTHYTPEKCKQAWAELIPSVTKNHTVKAIGNGQYLKSLFTMTFKYWRRKLYLQIIEIHRTLLGR